MLVFRKQIDNLKTNHRVCCLASSLPGQLTQCSLVLDAGLLLIIMYIGSLRFDRQCLPAVLEDEYGGWRRGGSTSGTGMIPYDLPYAFNPLEDHLLISKHSFYGFLVASSEARWRQWASTRQYRPRRANYLVQCFRSRPSQRNEQSSRPLFVCFAPATVLLPSCAKATQIYSGYASTLCEGKTWCV